MTSSLLSRARQSSPAMPLWLAGLIAIVLSAGINAGLYGIARAADLIPSSVLVETSGGREPITLAPVLLLSTLPVVGATLLYALLTRVTARPARSFWTIGIVVLVASFAMPFSIPDVPLKMALTLDLMHLVTAVVTLGTLTRVARPE